MALTFAYKTQTTYREPLDLKTRVMAWEFVLAERFAIDAVLYGLKRHMAENPVMPVPADIVKILSPDKPRITEAQYVAAQKAQERNGYPQFSPEAYTIREYVAQEATAQENHRIECVKVQAVLSGAVKRIGQTP